MLIVEDEALAAQSLARWVADLEPGIQIEPPLATVAAALQRLAHPPVPELVLLDVHLADGLCFELFDALPLSTPVIFTTAYDEFALRAFEVFGVDYLLKPIRPERLALALAKWRRVRGQHGPQRPPAALAEDYFRASAAPRQRFLVPVGAAMRSIAVGEIAYFAKEWVVRLITRDGRAFAIDQTLDELEPSLPPGRFFRLNRQVLAQIDAIGLVHRGSKGRLEVELQPPLGKPLTVSQERAPAFRAWLGGG